MTWSSIKETPMTRTTRFCPSMVLAVMASASVAAAAPAPAKKVIRPSGAAPAEAAAGSPAMLVGDTLYVAGQTGADPRTGQVPDTFEAQVKAALDNAGRVLKGARLGFSHVVKANLYLTDITRFDALNAVYRTYFKSNLPARTTVAVPALPGGAQFQIAFIASRKPHKAVHPKGVAPNPKLPFSPAVLVGETLYLSGQGSRALKTGELPVGEIEAHTKQALENNLLLLEAAGMGPANVVTANVYLTDMSLIGRMNEVYRTFFASDPPSRTTVGVPALPGAVPIEITFVATRSGKQVFATEGSRPNPNFSEVVAAGPMLYPAGKVGKGDNIEAHAKAALDGIGNALKAGGRGFDDVVEAKVYLTDLKDQDKVLSVFRTTFPQNPPALTTTAVSKLVGTSIIEITLVAAGAR
jgi:reactive intermediate/imine deaminase